MTQYYLQLFWINNSISFFVIIDFCCLLSWLFFLGLFAAAFDLKIEWVIVKGISHFGSGNSTAEKSWESHACMMAASLVSNMLKDSVVFKQWPHYNDNNEGMCKFFTFVQTFKFWLSTLVENITNDCQRFGASPFYIFRVLI